MLVRDANPSPDGRYVLTAATHRPFSYLVPGSRFPHRIAVLDLDGNLVKEIVDLPLAENVPTAFGSVPTGIRSIAWRADEPATLYWVEALDGGDAHAEADERDRVFTLDAPFDGDPVATAAETPQMEIAEASTAATFLGMRNSFLEIRYTPGQKIR